MGALQLQCCPDAYVQNKHWNIEGVKILNWPS